MAPSEDPDFFVPSDATTVPPTRVSASEPKTPRSAHRERNKGLVGVAVAVTVTMVLLSIVGGAYYLSRVLTSGPSSCSGMAKDAAGEAKGADRSVEVVVGLAGNSEAVAEEVALQVSSAGVTRSAEETTRLRVTLVNGDSEYQPTTGDGADCVGKWLLVSPATSDLSSYESASGSAKADIEKSLTKQYAKELGLVSAAVKDAVRYAPAPEAEPGGAFEIWPFVARAEAGAEVHVISTFALGGDNCLTIDRPAELGASGRTSISTVVQECVRLGDLANVNSKKLQLHGISALDLTGPQREAQDATMAALCAAASDGCSD